MEIKVVYLGNDISYWNKLKSTFKKDYPADNFEFVIFNLEDAFTPISCFIKLYEILPQIIYLDYSLKSKELIQLARLIGHNNEMRQISTVGLFPVKDKAEILNKSINASVRINYIKSDEVQDVVYDPMSFIDVEHAVMPEYVHSKAIDNFIIWQPLRLGYLGENHFHIETNSYLKEGDIVDIDNHPLLDIMPSRKVYIDKFYETNLFFNQRFAYDLEFIYKDNDYFVATNENWKKYKKWKKNPELIEKVPEDERDLVIADMDKRREIFTPTRDAIHTWMAKKSNRKFPKKLKIMVLDETLSLMKQVDDAQEFSFWINFQTYLKGDFYQLERSTPHLIIFHLSERNDLNIYSQMIQKIKKIENYKPFILLFNISEEDQKVIINRNLYDKTLYYEGEIELETIRDLAKRLDNKMDISATGSKVYIGHSDPMSLIFLKRVVKVISMSESILYFETEVPIPMWTVFKVKSPVDMILTVVPHKKEGNHAKTPNVYRCLINGVGEMEKAHIRQIINSTLKEDKEET